VDKEKRKGFNNKPAKSTNFFIDLREIFLKHENCWFYNNDYNNVF